MSRHVNALKALTQQQAKAGIKVDDNTKAILLNELPQNATILYSH